jgi:hypothetical protein
MERIFGWNNLEKMLLGMDVENKKMQIFSTDNPKLCTIFCCDSGKVEYLVDFSSDSISQMVETIHNAWNYKSTPDVIKIHSITKSMIIEITDTELRIAEGSSEEPSYKFSLPLDIARCTFYKISDKRIDSLLYGHAAFTRHDFVSRTLIDVLANTLRTPIDEGNRTYPTAIRVHYDFVSFLNSHSPVGVEVWNVNHSDDISKFCMRTRFTDVFSASTNEELLVLDHDVWGDRKLIVAVAEDSVCPIFSVQNLTIPSKDPERYAELVKKIDYVIKMLKNAFC